MTYQEKEISKSQLEKFIQVLDLDEGIRIENNSNMIFVNKSARRYCVNISTTQKDEFIYCDNSVQVLDFLRDKMAKDCKIFSY